MRARSAARRAAQVVAAVLRYVHVITVSRARATLHIRYDEEREQERRRRETRCGVVWCARSRGESGRVRVERRDI